MKPMGVVLVLGIVCALAFCLVPTLWGFVRSVRSRARKRAALLGILAAAIIVFNVWAVYAVAPKGGRTIAQLELADGRAFVLRHYRYGWLEYPKVCFYARDPYGVWTRFTVIAELIDANATTLLLNASAQEVALGKAGGTYRIPHNEFLNIDGSGSDGWPLPPGVAPDEDDIYRDTRRDSQ